MICLFFIWQLLFICQFDDTSASFIFTAANAANFTFHWGKQNLSLFVMTYKLIK